MDIMPEIDENGFAAFPLPKEEKSYLLGVISEGRFTSYFAGKDSPLMAEDDASSDTETRTSLAGFSSVTEHSPSSARIILYSSNDFLRDQTMTMANSAAGSEYLNPMQLMANTVDWALEDASMLSIRARGQFNRTLPPMDHDTQIFWEYLNYALAILALAIIALIQRKQQRSRQQHYLDVLAK